jgi:transcriptional regulator with XRE-family HTH domain
MKIISFKGRRLIADLDIEQVAEKTGINAAIVAKIENMEQDIKKLNDFYESLHSTIDDEN